MNNRAAVKLFLGVAVLNVCAWALFRVNEPVTPHTNPILVIGTGVRPFSGYYSEILRTEGFNGAGYADLTSVTPATLASRDVVILGETPLSAAQAAMFSEWVNEGGNLIAMRPDKRLAGLLGLSAAAGRLSDRYLRIDTAQGPGAGLVDQTIQFHGAADLYTLSGATAVAGLYTNASSATAHPAVSIRSVGDKGGEAAAFTYDLARSVVYTRQGNPAWAGTERDGIAPIRSNDMFFGAAISDPRPDWVDRSKIAIPQADEQQRLLANLILHMNQNRKPLPRFWYFPFGKKAAVVLTGDDHANGGTIGRFDSHIKASPEGCVVDNWECIRSTAYIYPRTEISAVEAQSYDSLGFEISLHLSTYCDDYSPYSLRAAYKNQLRDFRARYHTIPAPATHRTHCIAFPDWASQPKFELANGIRMDLNYYYWPAYWVKDVPGFMTGSGMPMRFANLDGSSIDVYQAATQMTDESGQSFPATSGALLDRALGPEGYYGFFVANIHGDHATGHQQELSDAVVGSAKARNVPVISARQLLAWIDGREGSSFTKYSWNGTILGFSIALAPGSNGAEVMAPFSFDGASVSSVTIAGTPTAFRTETIKGVQYAIFRAANGACQVRYSSLISSDAPGPLPANAQSRSGVVAEGYAAPEIRPADSNCCPQPAIHGGSSHAGLP